MSGEEYFEDDQEQDEDDEEYIEPEISEEHRDKRRRIDITPSRVNRSLKLDSKLRESSEFSKMWFSLNDQSIFELKEKLYSGGEGEIYECVWKGDSGSFVCKKIARCFEKAGRKQQSRSILLQTENLANCSSSCKFHGYSCDDRYFFFVFSRWDFDFRTFVHNDRLLGSEILALKTLFKCVKEIHLLGICHLDIKPSNILISNASKMCLCDFSCSQKVAEFKMTSNGIRSEAFEMYQRRN